MAYQTKNTRTHSSVPNPDNNNPAWPSLKLLGSSTLCLVVIVRNTSQNGIIPAASFVRPYVAHICFVFLLKDLSLTSERPSKLILWSSFRLWAVALQGGRGGGDSPFKDGYLHTHMLLAAATHIPVTVGRPAKQHTTSHTQTQRREKKRTHSFVRLCVCGFVLSSIFLSAQHKKPRNAPVYVCM